MWYFVIIFSYSIHQIRIRYSVLKAKLKINRKTRLSTYLIISLPRIKDDMDQIKVFQKEPN